ncbi:hypothetical protein ACE6H2_003033 [Prunus campanulata]
MRTYFVSNHGLSLIYNCHLGSHFILTTCWIHFNYCVNCYEFVLLCTMFCPLLIFFSFFVYHFHRGRCYWAYAHCKAVQAMCFSYVVQQNKSNECRAQYGERSPPPSAASFWVCQCKYFAQGIKGPSYRLIHGNTKEIFNMKMETMGSPRNLSDDVLSAVQPHIRSWTKIYGKNYLQWHGSQAQLVIMEPELCKEILSNKDGAYLKREPEGYVKKLVGDSMGTTNQADKSAKVRKLANHAFHGESLKSMIPAMIASAETMLDGWKNHEGKEIEVYEQFRLFTSEVISRTAFSSSYLEGKSFFDNLMKLSFLLVKNSFKVRFPGISKIFKSSDDIESEKLDKAMRDSIIAIVKKREKAAKTGEENNFGNDYLGLLLKAHLDTNDLVDECKTFYFAGQETTNGLLAWIIFLLALHTDWQEEARKEVLKLFGKQNPTHDDIPS